jgi:hypothetical protein
MDDGQRAQLTPPTPTDEQMQMHSPISHTNALGFGRHDSQIAPQSLFDSIHHGFYANRAVSPSGSVNGVGRQEHLEPPPSYEVLGKQFNALQTRVNELELINGLYRGEAARADERVRETEEREAALKKRIEELEEQLIRGEKRLRDLEERISADGPDSKKRRIGSEDGNDSVSDGSRRSSTSWRS